MSFVCNVCEITSHDPDQYLKHLRFHHILSEGKAFRCNYNGCLTKFSNEQSFRFHLMRKHSLSVNICKSTEDEEMLNGNELFSCSADECQKKFTESKPFINHLKSHLKQKCKVKCPFSNCQCHYSNLNSFCNHLRQKHPKKIESSDEMYGFDKNNLLDINEIEHYEKLYQDNLANFYLKYETLYRIPKTVINALVNDMENLHFQEREISLAKINNAFKQSGVAQSDINPLLNAVNTSDVFFKTNKQLNTVHKRSQYHNKKSTFIKPHKIALNDLRDGEISHFHYVPILETIEAVLQNDFLMTEIEKNTSKQNQIKNNANNKKVLDYYCGKAYEDNPFFKDDSNKIELILYQDAYEIVNPIGSARTKYKVLSIYLMIGNLPPHLRTRMDNIFLVAKVREKWFDQEKIFGRIEKDLKKFEQGLTLKNGKVIRGGCFCICGDNLGSHGICGLQESFGKFTTFFCRYCEINKTNFTIYSLPSFPTYFPLRSIESYNNDISELENLKNADKTITSYKGFKRKAIFTDLESFHCFRPGLPPCFAHDVMEGVIAYDLALIIGDLVNKKWFTHDELNQAIKEFNFAGEDGKNKPQPRLGPKLNKVIGSAWELRTLMRFLPLIVESLKKVKDSDCDTWQSLIVLSQITDFICAHEIHGDNLAYLQFLCEEYIYLRLKTFPNVELRPKHHYLCHYALFLHSFGPLMKLWTLRFESKHTFFKRAAAQTKNFKDVTKSLTVKHELYQHLLRNGLNAYIESDPTEIRQLKHHELSDELLSIINCNNMKGDLYQCSAIEYQHIHYKLHDLIVTDSMSYQRELCGGRIIKILLGEDVNDVLFLVERVALNFSSELQAYEVSECDSKIFDGVSVDRVLHEPLNIYCINGKNFVKLNHEIVQERI